MEIMTEDPLKILMDFTPMIFKSKSKTKFRIFHSVYIFIHIGFIIVGFAEGIFHGENKAVFLMGTVIFLPSCSVCLNMIIHGYEAFQNGRTVIEYGYSIDSGGREMKKKIMNDIRKIKCFLFVSLVLVILGGLLSTPLHEDEEFIFQNILMRKWFRGIEFIGLIINMLYGGITCYYLTSSGILLAHGVYNVTFQFQLLREYLERESKKFNDSNIIDDEQRQQRIHEVLTRFVKYHLKIKK
ncbi:hypothetical protein JTB14_006803 [Gonioctena quinquepunctata]|nr:hypothetical protein JTB14_006803 [Gonioctena quinquepunctata]